MREVFCSIVSAVVFRILFVFFVFEFGIVGATLGAIAGAMIGWNNEKRLKVDGIIIGAVSGTTFSYNLLKAISDYFNSDDDDELVSFVHLVKHTAGHLVKILDHDEHKIMRFNKALFSKAYAWVDSSIWSLKHGPSQVITCS